MLSIKIGRAHGHALATVDPETLSWSPEAEDGLLDLLTALADQMAQLPPPLGLFATELEAGLVAALGANDDC